MVSSTPAVNIALKTAFVKEIPPFISQESAERAEKRLTSVEKRLRKVETACDAIAGMVGGPTLHHKIKATKKADRTLKGVPGADERYVLVPSVKTTIVR
jgi:hypothetical protein